MLPVLRGWTVGMDAVTVCIVDGVFRLLLESWYMVAAAVAVVGDAQLRQDIPGLKLTADFLSQKIVHFSGGNRRPMVP